MKLLSAPLPNMSLRLRLGGGNGFVRSGLMLFVVLPKKKKPKKKTEEERRNLRTADSSREFESSAPIALAVMALVCKLAKMVLRLRLGGGNGLRQVGSAVIVLPKKKKQKLKRQEISGL
jgi:hypothetical protein